MYPLVVRGYHGTTLPRATKIVHDRRLDMSVNAYDWLGNGIYFWEAAPHRAWLWALYRARQTGDLPAVVSAFVTLRQCLNLLDVAGWKHVRAGSARYALEQALKGRPMPVQRAPSYLDPADRQQRHHLGDPATGPLNLNFLDHAVMEAAVAEAERVTGIDVLCVRAPFLEGQQLYPSSHYFDRNHVQIAVRDPIILGDMIIEDSTAFAQLYGANP
jgi:hypothetical protein